jgi:hypothetical protein
MKIYISERETVSDPLIANRIVSSTDEIALIANSINEALISARQSMKKTASSRIHILDEESLQLLNDQVDNYRQKVNAYETARLRALGYDKSESPRPVVIAAGLQAPVVHEGLLFGMGRIAARHADYTEAYNNMLGTVEYISESQLQNIESK